MRRPPPQFCRCHWRYEMSRLAHIPIGRVLPSPFNPRHEAEGIEDLAASIASVGIIEPLVVAVDKGDTEHVTLVCGNRRFAAAKLAGLKHVPCVVLPEVGERTQRMISLVENLHRRDMTHIEQGEAFRDLMTTGMTQRQVAAQTGVSDFTVSTKLTLVTKLIPEMRDLVHRDRMTMGEGLQMAKLPAAIQREIFNGGRKDKGRPSRAVPHRRSNTESCLMRALQCYRDGAWDLALVEAERAIGHLRNTAKGAA